MKKPARKDSRSLPVGKRRQDLSSETAMIKYKLTIEYDGTSYSGWQTQKNARSIQGTLIQAARDLLGQEVDVQGAGRTDAGVHALAQVAHLESSNTMPPKKLLEGLNDRLPSNINVLHAEKVHARFHARHHAVSRTYVYILSRRRTAFGKRYVWWVRDPLDGEKMQAAGRLFEGLHDFVSFADKRFDKDASTMVKIDRVEVIPKGDLIVFSITGSHFLWKMVRRMVGILVEVGRGKLTADGVAEMLQAFSETPAQCTAPPSGLFLLQVRYEGDQEDPVQLPFLILPGCMHPNSLRTFRHA
jgi:tRNA pseudouridine38-40 synthase